MRSTPTIAACLWAMTALTAAAQDQTLIVDQPLQTCKTPTAVTSATLTEPQAALVVKAALGKDPDPKAYYIVHATEFSPGNATVAEEHWYVYHAGWERRGFLEWVTDSRQAHRFTEARIMGSGNVGLVYLYVNVPTYEIANSRNDIASHFRTAHVMDKAPMSDDEKRARAGLIERLKASLSEEVEQAAERTAAAERQRRAAAAAKGETPAPASDDPEVETIVQLETERYLKAFGDADKQFADEIAFVNKDTGEALIGLSPTLATGARFASLNSLFYKVGVTRKTPAPLDNLKNAAKLAFAGEAADQTSLYVKVQDTAVCAGAGMTVKHVPSDLLVSARHKNAKEEEIERSKQLFDNEGRYWWDVSFALPLESYDDLTIDVDAGQIAAKKVEKTDLFAVVNLGVRRDTKKLQWQLIPSFVYGMPITGQPLEHHLVGLSLGLNYVQIIFGRRFDRITEVSTTTENGTPVGIESSPEQGDKWTREWVWAINIPVGTVVKLFTKDAKK